MSNTPKSDNLLRVEKHIEQARVGLLRAAMWADQTQMQGVADDLDQLRNELHRITESLARGRTGSSACRRAPSSR